MLQGDKLFDITKANLGVQLLSSCKDIAKLKWQHGLHGLLVDRLEGVLYDQGLQAQAQGRDYSRLQHVQKAQLLLAFDACVSGLEDGNKVL